MHLGCVVTVSGIDSASACCYLAYCYCAFFSPAPAGVRLSLFVQYCRRIDWRKSSLSSQIFPDRKCLYTNWRFIFVQQYFPRVFPPLAQISSEANVSFLISTKIAMNKEKCVSSFFRFFCTHFCITIESGWQQMVESIPIIDWNRLRRKLNQRVIFVSFITTSQAVNPIKHIT